MDIRSFAALLRRQGLPLFSVDDLRVLLPPEMRTALSLQLHQWRRKGWIARLKRGLYQLAYPEPVIVSDLYLANRLYEPSYVSLETALSHYQILPEFSAQVTSVTTKPTRRFSAASGLFTYFTIRPKSYAGYVLIHLQGWPIRMAEPEKAVVDRLYAAFRRGESVESATDRWDRERIKKMNKNKLKAYADLFGAAKGKWGKMIDAFL